MSGTQTHRILSSSRISLHKQLTFDPKLIFAYYHSVSHAAQLNFSEMTDANILYGGYEGNQHDICGNARSFGEFLLQKLKEAGNFVLFVS